MITDDIKAALEGVTQWPWYFHDGETLANTKLIAAAPDLLYRALGEIESLQAQLRTYGDQRAAEAREQMREELKTVKKHALNGVDLPCIECGIVGCNGECSGDGAMGD